LIFWGWLSDKVGRKPIILGGTALASLTYYPLYSALGTYADPANVNHPMAILIVAILVNYVGMTYGPIGAFLAEFFPSRIRYTSVSVPYHIGNGWGGGLVPIVTTSMYLDVPLDRERRLRVALPHHRTGRHVPDRGLRDAGDA
jgi:MFS family permease